MFLFLVDQKQTFCFILGMATIPSSEITDKLFAEIKVIRADIKTVKENIANPVWAFTIDGSKKQLADLEADLRTLEMTLGMVRRIIDGRSGNDLRNLSQLQS